MTNGVPSVLMIGVGRWGQNHLNVWQKLHREGACRLIGVQDINPRQLAFVADQTGVETFSDDSGFDQVDAVDIAVPTYAHFEVAQKALLCGKDVLVEKPVTQTVTEAVTLATLQERHSRVLMVGHLFRFNPAVDRTRELILAGEVGKVLFLRCDFKGFRPKEHDAGILAATAIHFIYLSSFLMGVSPQTVQASVMNNIGGGDNLDDHCIVRLGYGGDCGYSIIESEYFTTEKRRVIEVVGTRGVIRLDALGQKVDIHRKRRTQQFGVEDDGVIAQSDLTFQEPLRLELEHFLARVKDRGEPLVGIRDGIDVLRIIERAHESARLDKTLSLSE